VLTLAPVNICIVCMCVLFVLGGCGIVAS